MKKKIILYSDGACSGNPGPGGWASILHFPDDRVVELGGHSENTTNNKMELSAVGRALRYLGDVEHDLDSPIEVHTDSKYVMDGVMQWAPNWRKNGWKKADGKPVQNLEFWKRLLELIDERKGPVTWVHVRGHSGHPANDRCDEIAVAYSKGKSVRLYVGPLSSYSTDLSRR